MNNLHRPTQACTVCNLCGVVYETAAGIWLAVKTVDRLVGVLFVNSANSVLTHSLESAVQFQHP